MSGLSVAIVLLGASLAVGVGVAAGLDPTSFVYLALILAVGTAALMTALRAKKGGAGPRSCEECAGLNSPNAPYCKHCGARF